MSADIEKEQKAITESLRLRGPATPVARVSRKALAVVGGLLSAGLFGALAWSTLDHRRAAPPPPAAAPTRPPEKVSGLPRDYLRRGEPPVLGPPLPGDLGRPILGDRAALDALPQPGVSADTISTPTSSRAAQAGEGAAARGPGSLAPTSALFSIVAGRPEPPTAPRIESRKDDVRTTSPERLQSPASPYLLQAGAIIPAALLTGLRSDLQGVALAQVTEDVYDSLGGGYLLIPSGARLIGEYPAASGSGQSRLEVVWTRLILPSGRSVVLDKLPAADAQGMTGLQDGVDRHWRQVWSAAALSTVLSIGAEAGASDEDDLTRAVRRGASTAVGDVGRQVVGRSIALTPTLTVRPGAPLRVLLTRDLVLEPYAPEVVR